ncbi:hypothetical protein [Oceanispirochaeta sp.]|jgi:hypothetical protein|uniref:hypothetical protein n=1 Tax=Oceanispirochaeta sp. TaxID=2035350 RepID=UPI00262C82C1|nr:hypothetical protein [Oceanispirochaeta sp.]MDA3955642.1 hypothetical protein [Oceanispirochaeta sp.]
MDLVKLSNQFKLMLFVGVLILTGQLVSSGASPLEALPGMVIIIIIAMMALVLKDLVPLKFPAFAWATLIAFILTLPMLPVSAFLMEYINKVGFLATTTPILAFAGISVGNKIGILKKISWKLVVISLIVFSSTFFGSALIAQILLTMQGTI